MLILARCVEILLCCVSMSSSSSKRKSSEAVQLDGEQRLKIVSELAATHGVSKGGLSKTLKLLHDKGLLVDSLVEVPSKRGYERQVQRAFELDALRALGPYGPMLCETELPITTKEKDARPPSMYFIDPFALLFRVCAINAVFFGMLKAAAGAAGTKALKLILYVDGINPGNPWHQIHKSSCKQCTGASVISQVGSYDERKAGSCSPLCVKSGSNYCLESLLQ